MNDVPDLLPRVAAVLRESALDDAATADGHAAPASDDGLEHALSRALSPLLRTAPVPSPELRGLLDRGAPSRAAAPARRPDPEDRPGVVLPLRVRGRRALAGALVLAAAGVGATGLSAAANTLPRPWQRQVADFSRIHLPFDFPEPPAGAGDRPLSSAPGAPRASDTRPPHVETPGRLAARLAAPLTPTDHDANHDADPTGVSRTRDPAPAASGPARGDAGEAGRHADDRPSRGSQGADRGPAPGRSGTGQQSTGQDRSPQGQSSQDQSPPGHADSESGGGEQPSQAAGSGQPATSGQKQSSQKQSGQKSGQPATTSQKKSGQEQASQGSSGDEQPGRGRAAGSAGSSDAGAEGERDDGQGRRAPGADTDSGDAAAAAAASERLRTSLAEVLDLPTGATPGAAG
ncbi:hypothetical protein GCM10027596_26240 [Nocardioides korecus]